MLLNPQSELPLKLALREPCVIGWFGGLDEETRPAYRSHFRQWLLWLWAKPEWAGKMPSALLEFQENAVGRERLILPRLMVQYVQGRGGTGSVNLGRWCVRIVTPVNQRGANAVLAEW